MGWWWKKKGEDSSLFPKCYECNQPGHLRVDCPNFRKRIEKFEKKPFNDKKEKKTYITWEDNDMDSSEDSENEVVNLSLMAKNYESNEEEEHNPVIPLDNPSMKFGECIHC